MTEKQPDWLCADHWDRCLAQNPCDTCPSRTENRERFEKLIAVGKVDTTKLDLSMMAQISEINQTLRGRGNDTNCYNGILRRLSILEEREKWNKRTAERWTTWSGMIITILIAAVALVVSIAKHQQ